MALSRGLPGIIGTPLDHDEPGRSAGPDRSAAKGVGDTYRVNVVDDRMAVVSDIR